MRVSINCLTRQEGAAIKRALEDETARALVVTLGTLLHLPSDRARQRVLEWVADKFAEEKERGDERQN